MSTAIAEKQAIRCARCNKLLAEHRRTLLPSAYLLGSFAAWFRRR